MTVIIPKFLIGIVGRAFIRVVRNFPALFLLLCCGGLILGGLILGGVLESSVDARHVFLFRGFGGVMFAFYGWLSAFYILKLKNGEWDTFCERIYGVFEEM